MVALALASLAIMGAVAFYMVREGIMMSFCTLVNTLVSLLVAFGFWPPLANEFEPSFAGSFLEGFEDALALVIGFAFTFGLLKYLLKFIVKRDIQVPQAIATGGAALFGLIAGYFISGFLVCVFQTLPWHEQFFGFEANIQQKDFSTRILPADVTVLKLMDRCYEGTFKRVEEPIPVFPEFERNYGRYRRYGDERDPYIWPEPEPQPKTKTLPKEKEKETKDLKGKDTKAKDLKVKDKLKDKDFNNDNKENQKEKE